MNALEIKDCSSITLSAGLNALNLRELRDCIVKVDANSIYFHFLGRFMNTSFDEPEFSNDFASWVHTALHDKKLAEQLSVIDPSDFKNIEDLRKELVDIIEQRLDESESISWAKADQAFYFLKSQIVIFDTGLEIKNSDDMKTIIPILSSGSIYYHFIDARLRSQIGSDDFYSWLEQNDKTAVKLKNKLLSIDPLFSSLSRIKTLLIEAINSCSEEEK